MVAVLFRLQNTSTSWSPRSMSRWKWKVRTCSIWCIVWINFQRTCFVCCIVWVNFQRTCFVCCIVWINFQRTCFVCCIVWVNFQRTCFVCCTVWINFQRTCFVCCIVWINFQRTCFVCCIVWVNFQRTCFVWCIVWINFQRTCFVCCIVWINFLRTCFVCCIVWVNFQNIAKVDMNLISIIPGPAKFITLGSIPQFVHGELNHTPNACFFYLWTFVERLNGRSQNVARRLIVYLMLLGMQPSINLLIYLGRKWTLNWWWWWWWWWFELIFNDLTTDPARRKNIQAKFGSKIDQDDYFNVVLQWIWCDFSYTKFFFATALDFKFSRFCWQICCHLACCLYICTKIMLLTPSILSWLHTTGPCQQDRGKFYNISFYVYAILNIFAASLWRDFFSNSNIDAGFPAEFKN